ncbi:SCO family protein [Paenibacillus sp. GCM10023252]|uniref:SCO family protein n=1 Tax=Paenibacillus sp. GCM10023252 TaxID=3252649 RepID=UPI00361A977E
MGVIRKHGFKIAVLTLCAAMGIYLFIMNMEPKRTLPLNQPAPAFELTNLDGKQVSLESTNGKARIVYFYFANCPDVCPPTTYLLSQVQDKLEEDGSLGKEAEILSITFDPERDTPEAVRKFADRLDVDTTKGWEFLRPATEDASMKLARDFGVSVIKDEASAGYTHMNVITLVDKRGQIRKWINASAKEELTVDAIMDDFNIILQE